MSDLIERLRHADAHSQQRVLGSRIFSEAADEIERLRAGIKRLSDEEELCAGATGYDPFSMVYLAAKLARMEAENERLRADAKLLDAIQHESWDLRCFNIPTGGDDCDIGWSVISHWQAEPHERVVAEVYVDDPRTAIRAAISANGGQP